MVGKIDTPKENFPWKQLDNNIEFYLHADALKRHIEKILRVEDATMQHYRNIIRFTMGPYHIYIKLSHDKLHKPYKSLTSSLT